MNDDQCPRLVRAAYTAETITVYQVYAPPIADAAADDLYDTFAESQPPPAQRYPAGQGADDDG
jgi:hypothetical protein